MANKILVVDDNPEVRSTIRMILEKEGHKVAEAVNGPKALEIVRAEKPDLILLDVMMPEVDGWKVAKTIKEDPMLKDIKICMLTVKSSTLDALMSLDYAHADWHLSKPVDRKELLRVINELLSKSTQ